VLFIIICIVFTLAKLTTSQFVIKKLQNRYSREFTIVFDILTKLIGVGPNFSIITMDLSQLFCPGLVKR